VMAGRSAVRTVGAAFAVMSCRAKVALLGPPLWRVLAWRAISLPTILLLGAHAVGLALLHRRRSGAGGEVAFPGVQARRLSRVALVSTARALVRLHHLLLVAVVAC